MKRHVHEARKNQKGYKANWISKLLRENKRPEIKILECVVEGTGWQEREKYWIMKLKGEGHRLTNFTEGGDGLSSTTDRDWETL